MSDWHMKNRFLIAFLVLFLVVPVYADGPQPLVNDVFIAPGLSASSMSCPYMIGDVVFGVILPESDGDWENWTPEEQTQVMEEITDAGEWWIAREPKADLSFVYEFHTFPTAYEPIEKRHYDQGLWIVEMMAELGYGGFAYFDSVRAYNVDLRAKYGADWAFTIFVVDSSKDIDGKFSDGYFAYAYRGGPFMVMTYDNALYGIDKMDMVTAHEEGHLFCALDQYHAARFPCDRRSGYLDVENQNSDYPVYGGCLLREQSIMKWAPSAYPLGLVDHYARGQIGWWDQDCDDVLDPIDDFVDPDGCPVYTTYLPIVWR